MSFKYVSKVDTKVPEASDVTPLPGDRFLVGSDLNDRARVIGADGPVDSFRFAGVKKVASGIEAMTYVLSTQTLFVAIEERGELVSLHWDASGTEKPTLKAKLPLPKGDEPNSGIEGMQFLEARFSPTKKDQLLLAQEKNPSRLFMLPGSGEGPLEPIRLDPKVLDAFKDISALTLDPITGHPFITSDESAAYGELELGYGPDGMLEAKLVGDAQPLTDAKGEPLPRVEGAAFDSAGNFYVLTENDGQLHRLNREISAKP